jgi:hypothetical protein
MTIAHTRKRDRHLLNTLGNPYLCTKQYIAGGFPPEVWYAPNELIETNRDSPHKGPPYTSGSPFELTKFYVKRNYHNNDGFYAQGWGGTPTQPGREWFGNITTSSLPFLTYKEPTSGTVYWTQARMNTWISQDFPSDADLNSLGATAWSRFKPGKPISSSDQAVLELAKDGLPSVPGAQFLRTIARAKSSLIKALAGEYLNYEFGIKPIVNDLRNLYKAQRILEKRLFQLRRDNGQPVRRRGSFPMTIDKYYDVSTNGNFARPTNTSEFYGPAADPRNFRRIVGVTRSTVRFSGRFRYWIPDVGTNQWTDRTKLALFGINPNASLLYEVMPWSWLIDWFTNLGDVIDNLSVNAAENLVADYAYIMKEVDRRVYYETSVLLQSPEDGYSQFVASDVSVAGAVFKLRDSANPYGFGFTFDSLSWRQMAILTALGLSRSSNG